MDHSPIRPDQKASPRPFVCDLHGVRQSWDEYNKGGCSICMGFVPPAHSDWVDVETAGRMKVEEVDGPIDPMLVAKDAPFNPRKY